MKILDKQIEKKDDKVIVTKSVEQTYNKEDLIIELNNTQREKMHLTDQSKRLKDEYDRLIEKENDIKLMLQQFEDSKFEEVPQ